jgi:hypothetical protein
MIKDSKYSVEKSYALNAHYKAVAARAGVWFFDAGLVISVSDIDGIHYSAESHAILGLALAYFIKRQL